MVESCSILSCLGEVTILWMQMEPVEPEDPAELLVSGCAGRDENQKPKGPVFFGGSTEMEASKTVI